ncbi:MAG: 30S ribosomal protein S5 [Candidatus Parcubacteria bacterium]|nr:MAG: 30S ribosomal protein S5 [Candidatus Parcubacteria bacterium]
MAEKFEFKVIEVKRVAKAVEGGKRIKVRAVVVAGNLQGKVGIGVAKGDDIALAVEKARRLAEKNTTNTPLIEGTVPFEIENKFGATKILLKPAKKGRGLIAGNVVRTVLSLAGYTDVSAKILGVTKNPLVNALATIKTLEKLNKIYEKKLKLKTLINKENASTPDKVQIEEEK